ncbi:MAG: 3-hydroxyacyl-CoA dehydrogenase/enoyl-CoA hydratase family protein [Burkholderiales bacterium]
MKPRQLVVRKAAVLGAGVMGAQIAAHFVNAGIETLLFELAGKDGAPNANSQKAIDNLAKIEPSPLATASTLAFIEPANYDQHLPRLAECDLVIEAISERMDWKRDLYDKVAPHLAADIVFASNTSGLSINALAQAFPEALRHRFCGVHFFNPPRYMHLVELIACTQTDPALLDQLEAFLVTTLGKGIVRAKDTPNFISNRIGVFSMIATMVEAQKAGLAFDVVDALTGPAIGRPKSATFRTADVVGLDTLTHVVNTMRDTLPDDPWHKYFALPGWLEDLIKSGALGAKSRRGIYQKVGKEIQVLDIARGSYRPSTGMADDEIQQILKLEHPGEKLRALRANPHPQAQFLWAIFRDVFHYSAFHLHAIADNARDVDLVLRWGFGWERGPFETWQAAGWQDITHAIEADIAAGKALSDAPLPAWVAGRQGVHEAAGSYAPLGNAIEARSTLVVYRRQLFPDALLGEPVQYGQTIFETEAARLWHTGDDIAILSFKSKKNTIGSDVLDAILQAIDEAERQWRALVIWQTAPPFSLGANLAKITNSGPSVEPSAPSAPSVTGAVIKRFKRKAQALVLGAARRFGFADQLMAGKLAEIESVVEQFQYTTQALKYSSVPTIAAVDGMALGGGCELIMHCERAVASLESYTGLVEVGVGLLPAGGGCKEFALRAAAEAKAAGNSDVFAPLQRHFQTIATGQVSKSAAQAKEFGYLRSSDAIVMNRFELLHVAKSQAIAIAEAGYHPPLKPRGVPVAGQPGIANFKAAMINMRAGNFISEHDFEIGARVATVLCGGEVEAGSLVDEDWLLALERKLFMELMATEKTQARIAQMLKTGKPLRN